MNSENINNPQDVPNTIPVAKQFRPKNNWPISLIFFAVGIIIGVGGLSVYQKYVAVKPVVTASPTPVAVATPDPTANWKTYTNTKYGFSFKYPSNWQLIDQSEIVGSITLGLSGTQSYLTNFYILGNANKLAAKDYVDKLVSTQGTPDGLPKFDSRENTTIDGIPGVKLTNVYAFDEGNDEIFVAFGNHILKISYPTKQENPNLQDPIGNFDIVQNVLSTFKFTNTATPNSTKHYILKDGVSSLDYPQNWQITDRTTQVDLYSDGKLQWSQNILIEKDGYSISSSNPLAWGPSGCIFPDSTDYNSNDVYGTKYDKYVEFSDKNTTYRRVKTLSKNNQQTWTVCTRTIGENGGFGTVSGFGATSYTTPLTYDEKTLSIMDEILLSIKTK